jgi:hypothetical protein
VNDLDSQLTGSGLKPAGNGRVLLLACGALAHEILALRASNGWDHLDLQCLPAIYHNHPERIIPAIRAAVLAHQGSYQRIFVVYADCGTGGQLQAACAEMGIEMIALLQLFYRKRGFRAGRGNDSLLLDRLSGAPV